MAHTWPDTPDEHDRYQDWQYEVRNGDTILSFRDWMDHNPRTKEQPRC